MKYRSLVFLESTLELFLPGHTYQTELLKKSNRLLVKERQKLTAYMVYYYLLTTVYYVFMESL